MTKVLGLVSVCCFLHLMGAGSAHSKPPGPGKHFDCSDAPGATSCATDDAGCVSNTVHHKRCAEGLVRFSMKALAKAIHCHYSQALARREGKPADIADSKEEGCESDASAVFSGAIAALTPICDPAQITAAGDLFSLLFSSLDSANGNTYCDSTSGALLGGDDAGWVPASHTNVLTCETDVAKNLFKLTEFGLRCHVRMDINFFRGDQFDEEACEAHVLAKYNQGRDKLVTHTCALVPCQDQAHQDAAAAAVSSQLDGSYSSAFFPCGLSSPSGAFLDVER